MSNFKQLITKVSIATATIAIGLSSLPANANTHSNSKTCTHDPVHNRTVCQQRMTGSTRSVNRHSSSRNNSYFRVNISKPNTNGIVNDLLVPKKHHSPRFNHHRRHQIPSIYF